MECNFEYDQESDCLIARCQGDITIRFLRDYKAEVLRKAQKHDCMCVLNDFRNMELEMTIGEIYEWQNIVMIEGLDRKWRRAIVAKEQYMDDIKFYETASENRGYRVKVFTEFDDAINWLKSEK
jgi:hypothetical protein